MSCVSAPDAALSRVVARSAAASECPETLSALPTCDVKVGRCTRLTNRFGGDGWPLWVEVLFGGSLAGDSCGALTLPTRSRRMLGQGESKLSDVDAQYR